MKNDNSSPIFESKTQARYGHEAAIRVYNLEGQAEIVVESDSGDSLVVPAQFLNSLAALSNAAQSEITNAIDLLRRRENHPTKFSNDLISITRRSRWSSTQEEFGIDRNDSPYYNAEEKTMVCFSEFDPNNDGTPYMEWAFDDESKTHGWKLRVSGIPDVNLAWSKWDDVSGIKDSLDMLKDPESCLVIAGVVDPTATAQMSSRVAAKALRSGRKLPGINMPKVRKVFADFVNTPDLSEVDGYVASRLLPNAKILSVPSGDKKVPVAVAIIAPNRFPDQRTLTDEAARKMAYKARSDWEAAAYLEKLEPWQKDINDAFARAGWRQVSLPKPRYAWGLNYEKVQWFTLLNEELWSTVAPAARHYASTNFSMSRTTQINE